MKYDGISNFSYEYFVIKDKQKDSISRVCNYVRVSMLGFFLALLTRTEIDFYEFLCCVIATDVCRNCGMCVFWVRQAYVAPQNNVQSFL